MKQQKQTVGLVGNLGANTGQLKNVTIDISKLGSELSKDVDKLGGALVSDVGKVGVEVAADVDKLGSEVAGDVGSALNFGVSQLGGSLTVKV